MDDKDVQSTDQDEITPEPEMAMEEEQDEPVLDRFKRMFAVLSAPADAISGIRINGGWIYPFLALIICLTFWVFTAGPYIGEEGVDAARDQMQQRVAEGQMTQEQADQALEVSAGFQTGIGGRVMQLVGTLFVVFVFTLLNSVLFLLVGNVIHNGSEAFSKYWSLAWYMMVPGFINFVLMGLLVMLTQDAHGGYLGLAILTKSDPTSAMHQAANAVNIFTIWEAIIAGIGISIFGKVGRGIGIVWGFILVLVIPAVLAYVLTNAFSGLGG